MTTSTPTRLQDKALATLTRDAIRAIKRSEKQYARMQIAEFLASLAHMNYSDRVKRCLWWIQMGKRGSDHE